MRHNGQNGSTSAGNGQATTVAALRAQLVRAEKPRSVVRLRETTLKARLLRVPLLWKLVGANGILVVAAIIVSLTAHHSTAVFATTLLISLAINLSLVRLALEPLKDLETTASKVWQGDLDARVEASTIADRDMVRVGSTLNLLLDGLVADRSRMRLLASQVINAQDAERARVARELHDGTAQTLAAAILQLSAVARHASSPEAADALSELRSLVAAALEEVRSLSHTIHPRVLDDLGLVSALEWLARQTRQEGVLEVEVQAGPGVETIPAAASAVFYRVAQESLRNIVQHARATHVVIALSIVNDAATLSIIDDGKGFDVSHAEVRRPGMGLFSIRERVSLVNGTVAIQSLPGHGARVIATIPLGALRVS